RPLRESRSISGPIASPTTTVGRNVTRKSAETHHVEFVRDPTSAVSAIVAIHVPTPEPRLARNSRRYMPFPRTAVRPRIGLPRLTHARARDRAHPRTRRAPP